MKNLTNFLLMVSFLFSAFSLQVKAQEKEKGKLAQVEKEVEKKSDGKDSHPNINFDISCDQEIVFDDSASVASAIEGTFMMIGLGYYSTKTALNILFAFPNEIDSGFWDIGYSDFPYSDYSNGLFDRTSLKKYSVYANINYFRESNTLNAINFNARLSPVPVIALELNYSDFTEKLTTRFDHLRVYDLFINYNRLKFENFAFWWGIGLKGIKGDRDNQAFALNFGTNIFIPNRPVSIGVNLNIGFYDVNNVYDFTPKIRYHIQRAEISLGYRHFSAGSVSINGWTVGLGFYL